MKTLQVLMISVLAVLISYLIVTGIYWVALWSFEFPIVFTWKSSLGVFLVYSLMTPKSGSKTMKKLMKINENKEQNDESK